jgi:hypothetical protein
MARKILKRFYKRCEIQQDRKDTKFSQISILSGWIWKIKVSPYPLSQTLSLALKNQLSKPHIHTPKESSVYHFGLEWTLCGKVPKVADYHTYVPYRHLTIYKQHLLNMSCITVVLQYVFFLDHAKDLRVFVLRKKV